MKYYLAGFGMSALLHVGALLASMPLLLGQDKLGQVEEPLPVMLSLAQFIPATPPESAATPPAAPEPESESPQPEPKPAEKPKPKPTVEKKPVEKASPTPKPKQQQPKLESKPLMQAVTAAPAVSHPAATTQQAVPPAQSADNRAAEAAYKARLENLIASRKQYPHKAENAGEEGSVVVSFTVLPNGVFTGVRVSNSSGNTFLDKAAAQAVNATSGALPFPPEIRKAQWVFSLTVNFRLDW